MSEAASTFGRVVRMQSLPLFPGLFDAPVAPVASSGGAGEPPARRGRKSKGQATAVAAAVVEAIVPVLPLAMAPVATPAPAPVAVPVRLVEAAVRPLRPEAGVVIFDVETTGTDRKRDQVIELCMQRGLSGTDYKIWRFKPTVAISQGAEDVHGISMEQLADCPAFATCAEEIRAWFAAAEVIVGYNLVFDVDMLQAEYERAGRPPLDLASKAVVDPFRLWQQCEPRSLQHAHQRFVGQGFEAAHSAAADVAATGRVLAGMLSTFGLDDQDWSGVATVCDPNRQNWVGPSRHLQWKDGAVVLSFGKHQGAPLHVLATGENHGYLRWVCDRDFPAHVGEICGRALELAGDLEGLLGWVRDRFGAPPVAPDVAASPRAPGPAVAAARA